MTTNIDFQPHATKQERYQTLLPQLKALLEHETDPIANLANTAAALKQTFDFFWVGFYLIKQNELVLAPFQGPVACTRIAYGRGVCGSAWQQNQTIIVADTNGFEGHIACSPLSKSEIVCPLYNQNNQIVGVLDIDSTKLNTFDQTDKTYLEKILLMIKINH